MKKRPFCASCSMRSGSICRRTTTAPREHRPRSRRSGELYLPLEGLIDLEAERQRLGKEIAKSEAELVTVRKKLANENFVANAPAAVVAEHRQRESDFAERLAQLERMRDSLG